MEWRNERQMYKMNCGCWHLIFPFFYLVGNIMFMHISIRWALTYVWLAVFIRLEVNKRGRMATSSFTCGKAWKCKVLAK